MSKYYNKVSMREPLCLKYFLLVYLDCYDLRFAILHMSPLSLSTKGVLPKTEKSCKKPILFSSTTNVLLTALHFSGTLLHTLLLFLLILIPSYAVTPHSVRNTLLTFVIAFVHSCTINPGNVSPFPHQKSVPLLVACELRYPPCSGALGSPATKVSATILVHCNCIV